jgi:CheY-like chemotaxis protein
VLAHFYPLKIGSLLIFYKGYLCSCDIRAHELAYQQPRIPIIGVTAFCQRQDREDCFKAGMDDYIGKPFKAEELDEKIERLLRNKGED